MKKKILKDKPIAIDTEEWLYKGCFIQLFKHPHLFGKYSVYKNNEEQTDVDRCHTFTEAKKLCEENECFDNYQNFDEYIPKNQ